MRFYQLLVSDWFDSSLDLRYVFVENFATLAEALICSWWQFEDKKGVSDGVTYEERGTEYCQFHLQYVDDQGRATLELRHEKFGYPEGCSVYQVVSQRKIWIKEITL